MGTQIVLTSPNYSGFVADITFYAQTGGTISLGSHLTPYTADLDYYYGTYQLCYSAFGYCCETTIVAPTNTPTVTPTNTPTPSITATNTATPTCTPTDTPNATPTQTPSNTATPTQTSSNTPTQTQTQTQTQTPTQTRTPTVTPTKTTTPTNTSTPTQTRTGTPTVTPTKSQFYYGYRIRAYIQTIAPPNPPTCNAAAGTINIRSLDFLEVGRFYYQEGPCRVYIIEASISSSGSNPIYFFQGGPHTTCLNAYNNCNA